MKRNIYIPIVILSALLILTNCGEEQPVIEKDHEENGMKKNTELVQLSQAELTEFGIELDSASPGNIQVHVTLPGEIVIPSDQLAHIYPRFPGIVKRVFKSVGDNVKKGETLAIIEGNESLSEYAVISLIDGTVIEKHLTRGEVVNDTEHGFVIADLTEVWAELSLYQRDIPFVKVGQTVKISAGNDMPDIESKVGYISPIINEASRTATVRVIIQNLNQVWKPGLFVTGEVITESRRVKIAVPKTALEQFEGSTVVFIQVDGGFEPHPVKLGLSNRKMVEIISGLKLGSSYVMKGGFTLKSELQKSEMSAGHAH